MRTQNQANHSPKSADNAGSAEPLRLLIVNTVKTNFNGQAMFALKYLRSMDLTGMHVGFVAINTPPASMSDELKALGVHLYELPERRTAPLVYFKKLTGIIRRGKYNIVHAHGNSSTLILEMIAALLGGAKARIAHSHNTQCKYQTLQKILTPFFQMVTNYRMACGQEAGRWMFGKRSFEVIPIAADPSVYAFDDEKRREMRQAMNLDAYTLIGSISQFVACKNHSFMLEAFAQAYKCNPQLRLLLIGDGRLESQVKENVAQLDLCEAVIFTGAVDDVPARMQALDVMVLPSLHEGFPNVLVEAQLAGLPALVSDSVTRDCDMTGLLSYLPLDVSIWSDAMSNFTQIDRVEASRQGCIQVAAHGYDVRVEAAKLKARYESML